MIKRLVIALLLLFSSDCMAWGAKGHMVIAKIAEGNLSDKARERVRSILGNSSLVAVSTWADDIRTTWQASANWHYVNIPFSAKGYDKKRDCENSSKGDCIIEEIERCIKTLKSKGERQDIALKMLIHLIGDLHQPFHCIDKNDGGGNSVNVTYQNAQFNLHELWDSGLIDARGLSINQYASLLEQQLSAEDRAKISKGSIISWANDSHQIAQGAYLPNSSSVSLGYSKKSLAKIDAQIVSAGIRLANLLNSILE